MQHDRPILLFILMFLLLFWVNACESRTSLKTNEIGTPYPTAISRINSTTSIPPVVIENIRSATPILPTTLPTIPLLTAISMANLSPVQESKLVEVLQSEDCELPCYLGITPGKTTWPDAQQILFNLGAQYQGDDYEEGWHVYNYYQVVGEPVLSEHTPSPENTPSHQQGIYQALGFTVGDSVVQRISVSIHTFDQAPKLYKYWFRYLPQQPLSGWAIQVEFI